MMIRGGEEEGGGEIRKTPLELETYMMDTLLFAG